MTQLIQKLCWPAATARPAQRTQRRHLKKVTSGAQISSPTSPCDGIARPSCRFFCASRFFFLLSEKNKNWFSRERVAMLRLLLLGAAVLAVAVQRGAAVTVPCDCWITFGRLQRPVHDVHPASVQSTSTRVRVLSRLRGGAPAKKDKREKTRNKRGGAATARTEWDESEGDEGGGGWALTDEEKEQIAREERLIEEQEKALLAAGGGNNAGGIGDGMRRSAGGTFHQLRNMPEETPAGWDPCADWDLRVRSKIWWKDQRERSVLDSLPAGFARMWHACRVGAVPWVEELLASGEVAATATDPDNRDKTPLHLAALRGNRMCCEVLLAHGADLNAQDDQQSTPLHCAAAYGRLDTCRMLLDKGAWKDVTDCNGETPLDLAISYRREEVTLWMLEQVSTIPNPRPRVSVTLDQKTARSLARAMRCLTAPAREPPRPQSPNAD